MPEDFEEHDNRRSSDLYGRREYDLRLENLERAAAQAWTSATDVALLTEKVANLEHGLGKVDEAMEKGLTSMNDEVAGLRKTLVGFAFSIAGSAIVFAIGVFALVGR